MLWKKPLSGTERATGSMYADARYVRVVQVTSDAIDCELLYVCDRDAYPTKEAFQAWRAGKPLEEVQQAGAQVRRTRMTLQDLQQLNDETVGEQSFSCAHASCDHSVCPYYYAMFLIWRKELSKGPVEAVSRAISTSVDSSSSSIHSAIETVLKRMDGYVGMRDLKQQVADFAYYLLFQKVRSKISATEPMMLHMAFKGKPGTGKTTVARDISEILYTLGYTRSPSVVEVSRKDLVAGYVGQTALKTADVVGRARGGVLFIDEAYGLKSDPSDGRGDFGSEAVEVLIKAMEDMRHELVVIFAGYEREMDEFLSMNPGLHSRIPYTFQFDNYSAVELVDIFTLLAGRRGFRASEEVIHYLKSQVERDIDSPNFGNGRYVRNVLERLIVTHGAAMGRKYGLEIPETFLTTLTTLPES